MTTNNIYKKRLNISTNDQSLFGSPKGIRTPVTRMKT